MNHRFPRPEFALYASHVCSCVFCSIVPVSVSVSVSPHLSPSLLRGAPSLIQGLDALSNITPHVELGSQMGVDLNTHETMSKVCEGVGGWASACLSVCEWVSEREREI